MESVLSKPIEPISFYVDVNDLNRKTLIELEQKGIIKKYDLTPEDREEHDRRITKIRNDKKLTDLQKREAYAQEDKEFGKFRV